MESIELKDFVREVLVQIIEGVQEAQSYTDKYGALINPVNMYGMKEKEGLKAVEFDIAVTATEGKSKKGGIGVLTAAVGFGGQKESENKNSTMNRINFSIPIMVPCKYLAKDNGQAKS